MNQEDMESRDKQSKEVGMESFEMEGLTKRMPYAPLPEGYFESFAAETMAKIEAESQMVRESRRWRVILSSSIAVAASVAVALTTLLVDIPTQQLSIDAFDNNLELYVESLSDEALTSLYYETESIEVFFNNL